MTEQQTDARAQAQENRPAYTAYELDYFLRLDDSRAAAITREQMSLRSAPAEAAEYVEASVTASLFARQKLRRGQGDSWLLTEEAQVIASNLTRADRWLGLALATAEGMRLAFMLAAEDVVLLYTQDELDTFVVSAVQGRDAVPEAITRIARSFLSDDAGRTVSLRRTDASAAGTVAQVLLRVGPDGAWQIAHEPLDEKQELTVSDMSPEQVEAVVRRLWDEGVSAAPTA